ncbi:ATP-binding protein, partial [Streptomyces virginiae]
LAQAYGFQVSLRSSAYGGVRAVVIVPQHLITTASAATGLAHGIGSSSGPRAVSATPREHPVDASSVGVSVPRPAPAPMSGPMPGPMPVSGGATSERTATGLPQRRRKDRVTTSDVRPAAGPQPADDNGPGMWLEAFHSGLAGEPGQDAPGAQDSSGSATKGA